MDKKYILDNISSNQVAEIDKEILMKDLNSAKEELFMCKQYFNMVTDSSLIDYAIFKEDAANARYSYFLQLAKLYGIKDYGNYTLRRIKTG